MTDIEQEARAEAERAAVQAEIIWEAIGDALGNLYYELDDQEAVEAFVYSLPRLRPASPATLGERALGDVIEDALHSEAMVETRGYQGDDPEEWVSEPVGLLVGTITKAVLAAIPAASPATGGTVTEEMVERAARAAYDRAFLKHAPEYVDRWDDLVTDNDAAAESWRDVARAALEAALTEGNAD